MSLTKTNQPKIGHPRGYMNFPVSTAIDGSGSNQNLEAADRRGPTA